MWRRCPPASAGWLLLLCRCWLFAPKCSPLWRIPHPGYGSQKHHLPYSHFWPMYTWKKIFPPSMKKSVPMCALAPLSQKDYWKAILIHLDLYGSTTVSHTRHHLLFHALGQPAILNLWEHLWFCYCILMWTPCSNYCAKSYTLNLRAASLQQNSYRLAIVVCKYRDEFCQRVNALSWALTDSRPNIM